MASPPLTKCFASRKTKQEEENSKKIYQHYRDELSKLPAFDGCSMLKLYLYKGWFAPMTAMVSAAVAQHLFQAKNSDVILATIPKSGTTWLKALLFATVHRNSSYYDVHHYLTTLSSHVCVPFLEGHTYVDDQIPDLDLLPSPRLFSTHIPFHLLPDSINRSGCKVVYLCRNPKDNFVSLWHFVNKINLNKGAEALSLEQSLDHFCNGLSHRGPFWNHVLGYWKASLERPKQVLFITYENFMKDPKAELKRLAEFTGYPFSTDEEKDGVVESILTLCSFEKQSGLEVNQKTKTSIEGLNRIMLFRRGEIGAWVNYLTPEMAERVDKITEEKFRGSGLSL